MSTIPISTLVSVSPGVIAAGGDGLDLLGLVLTNNPRVPIGTVLSIANGGGGAPNSNVSAYFGPAAAETTDAGYYFAGFDGSTLKPAAILFAQYNTTAVSAYLRGASMAGVPLATIQAASGAIAITVNGATQNATVVLSGATSPSNAASIIQAALTGVAVAFDSVSNAFTITTTTTGAAATISFASGAVATALLLSQATGAVTSQGAAANTPAAMMNGVINQTTNFATFKVLSVSDADAQAFALWNSQQNNRYLYVLASSEVAMTATPDTTSAAGLITTAGYGGALPYYNGPSTGGGAAVQGIVASLDFNQNNGRQTLAYRSQSGLVAGVSDGATAAALMNNRYNFYGLYAGNNNSFTFFQSGAITGPFKWMDTYVQQIKFNADLQASVVLLLMSVGSIPYNPTGDAMIESAFADDIQTALGYGTIRENVVLSSLQASEVNNAAGLAIDGVLSTRGWYVQVGVASAAVRAARGSPPITVWYCDGESVQSINVSSLVVQ